MSSSSLGVACCLWLAACLMAVLHPANVTLRRGTALRPASWLVPKAPQNCNEGPRCREARQLLQQCAGTLAAQKLLEAADPLDNDIVDGLNLVAFACGVSSDQTCLQNLLREVAAILGTLPEQSVDLAHLPKLSELVSSVLNLEADESTASEVAKLCAISETPERLPVAKAIHQVAASSSHKGQRVRLGLRIWDQAKQDGLAWPEAYALAHLLAGCSLAGADSHSSAHRVAKALQSCCCLASSLQPPLLNFCHSLLGDSSRLNHEAHLVQLASESAAAAGCVAKARHGAVVQDCSGEILSVGMNRNVRLATGRNMDIHAELDALLRLPDLRAAEGSPSPSGPGLCPTSVSGHEFRARSVVTRFSSIYGSEEETATNWSSRSNDMKSGGRTNERSGRR